MDNLDFTDIERRRRILRIVLFVIILGTLPFYCAGFLLLGTARQARVRDVTPPPTSTLLQNVRPTFTPFPTLRLAVTVTQLSPLRPTPLQFNPGFPVVPTSPIIILPPTQVFIPTNTFAPTLTPFPTQVPPTNPPPATWTPLPTDVPPPTEIPTDVPPPPTDVPPPTAAPPPTDAPLPTDAAPAEPPPGA